MSILSLVVSCLCFFVLPVYAYDIATMTVEEKVGQLLMVHFLGHEVNDDAKLLVQKAHVGGIIYFRTANGLTSPEQVQNISTELQKIADIPLLIAIDQEGGRISHLTEGFMVFASNWDVGQNHDAKHAQDIAYTSSMQLQSLGINMNLAPVVDVNTNPLNPVIGDRSFSADPKQVALFGKAALQGYREGGTIATLKHFPGHGDTGVDSHYGLPIIDKTVSELELCELYPFAQLANEAEVIMSAHILVPALDPVHCATFSKPILEGVLREKLGFTGVIISDSLLMDGALLQAGSLEDAAINACNAGCDLLIIAGAFSKETLGSADSMYKVYLALVEAVRDGRITEERLNTSVERILQLKQKHGL